VVEAIARVDGSAGWSLMIGSSYGVFAGFLSENVAQEIYGSPTTVVGGTLSPSGTATLTENGYRVRGHWSFASGIQHCAWLIGNCVVHDGDSPRLGVDGMPETRVVFFPASEAEVIDTWRTGGLRGTGSHDYAVTDTFVPSERSFDALAPSPQQPGRLYAFPITLLTFSVAAALLGMARGAIDAFVEMADPERAGATQLGGRGAQADVARAEALTQSARSYLLAAADDIWQTLARSGAVSELQRSTLRLASTHAATSTVQAVDLVYAAAGAGAIYESSPLERYSRDVHVAAQHVAISPANYERYARTLLAGA
jgi:alkylation response protein AidB-like acyl-CoA dehydrogenase